MRKLILLLTLFLLSASVFGQSHSSKRAIVGIVRDENGAVVSNVVVTASAVSGKGIDAYEIKKKGVTGKDGRYLISRLAPAIYTITFSKKGYEKMVYRIRTKDDEDAIIDVVLLPK